MTRACPVCRGRMTEMRVRHVQAWREQVVVFENVPVDACEQCGETLFAGLVVDRLNEILWSMPPATRTVEVPVYDLSGA